MWVFILMLLTSLLQDGCCSPRHHACVKGREKMEKERGSGDTFVRKTEAFPEIHHSSLPMFIGFGRLLITTYKCKSVCRTKHCKAGGWRRRAHWLNLAWCLFFFTCFHDHLMLFNTPPHAITTLLSMSDAYFCKQSLIRTQPYPFIYIISMVAFSSTEN